MLEPYVESQRMYSDDDETQIKQEIFVIRNILDYINEVLSIMQNKKYLYGSPKNYTQDMMIIKAYTKCCYLYNRYNHMQLSEAIRTLYEIALDYIMIIEYNEGGVWDDHNYLGAKYISLINRLYQQKHNEYNESYKTEDTLSPEEVIALILMKSIRIKNILNRLKSDDKVKDTLLDNAKDIVIFCYILYNKIKNSERSDYYVLV